MSEKHLTELLWKQLVIKQGIKDIGLGKALAAHATVDPTKEPAKALDGLKEIAELAAKLKKANPTKADVVAHLDELVKEVKKAIPALEAMAKSAAAAAAAATPVVPAKPAEAVSAKPAAGAKPAEEVEKEAEEQEAAAFKKDLKQQMVSALAQVKARAPGEPEQEKDPKPQLQFMAYLAGKTCAVVVGRRVGSATKKLLPEIAGGVSGGQSVQGECIFEKNAHTFVLAKVPGGLAKKLATALQTETGQKYRVRARSIDGSVTLDSDTDVDPDAAIVGGNPAIEWKAKLAEWLPGIKEALAAKGSNAAAMTKLLTEASALSKPGGDMVALAKLTACHGMAAAVARWAVERDKVAVNLLAEIKEIVDTKDPLAGNAELELNAVLRQLKGELATQRQAAEMDRYLQDDDVVADVSELAFDLKTPLLQVLGEITPLLPA